MDHLLRNHRSGAVFVPINGPVDQWKIACFASRRTWVQMLVSPAGYPIRSISPIGLKKIDW